MPLFSTWHIIGEEELECHYYPVPLSISQKAGSVKEKYRLHLLMGKESCTAMQLELMEPSLETTLWALQSNLMSFKCSIPIVFTPLAETIIFLQEKEIKKNIKEKNVATES